MYKVLPFYHLGKAYVSLAQLPEHQLKKFANWISSEQMLNIGSSSGQIEKCIQYEAYDEWYETLKLEDSALYEF